MFKPTAKNIIVSVVWVLMIAFTIFGIIASHIPTSYIKTTYSVNSVVHPPTFENGYYSVKAYFTANNGKKYPLSFTSQFADGAFDDSGYYVHYDPSNPTKNILGTPDPIVILFIPVGAAALVTFLVYSKITFISGSKKK